MTIKQFSDLVDQRAKAYAEIHDCSYLEAFHRVLDDNPRLKVAYAGIEEQATVHPSPKTSSHTQRQAGDRINELVVALMAEQEGICSYAECLRIVLSENPDLARRYIYE